MLLTILFILIGVELGWEVGATRRVLTGVEALEILISGCAKLAALRGWTGTGLMGLLFIYILTFFIMNQCKINRLL